jgi:NTE family protein
MGLVLTAGGARGAYQAGVLKRIGELPALKDRPSPFPIIVGASAGAINSGYLAAKSANFSQATRRLAEVWANLSVEDVFRTDLGTLGKGAARWLRDLSFGGMWGGGAAESLLDASPLRGFLERNLPLDEVAGAIEAGHLYAVAISATSYFSGKSILFIQGKAGHPLWNKVRRIAIATPLQIDHVLASCAIPVVFQPVKICFERGDYYFGDGGLRLITPFSPAIRLGADRVFAIGIRSHVAAVNRPYEHQLLGEKKDNRFIMRRPPLAQVMGITLNAIFLDHLDTDLDHLKRMNDLLRAYGPAAIENTELKEPMRAIEPFVINPSVDLAEVASSHAERMPRFVRYLMEGLGHSTAQAADLMSYLLFDSHYTNDLVEIGYQDASNQIAEIENFLRLR